MQLSVVIVSYDTRDLLRACLTSVIAETSNVSYEVVVVDNDSADGSAAMVASEFPSVKLMALADNSGFARGCNLGVRESCGDYVVLLNPDTVVHDRALERLLAFGRSHPEAGLCGGRTLKPSGELDPSSCFGQCSLWSLLCYALGLSTVLRGSRVFDPESLGRWKRDSVRHVGIVTGCLLLVERRTWDELEGFDEAFWMYAEDADLAARAVKHGFRPLITPDATVTHMMGASTPSGARQRQMVLTGKVTLFDKHWSPRRAAAGRRLLFAGVGLRAAAGRLLRPSSPWREVWSNRESWGAGWPTTPRAGGPTLSGSVDAGPAPRDSAA